MAACTPTPTATLFGTTDVVVSTSTSTSFQTVTSTVSGATSTSTETDCPVTDTPCPDPVTTTITTTLPDTTTTLTNQIPVAIPITSTSTFPTATLFSTCPTPVQPPANPPPSSTPPTSSVVTPPPTTSASSSVSVLPNGQTTTMIIQVTYTPPPSVVIASPSMTPTNQSQGGGTGGSTNLAPILGGALGGFFGLLIIFGIFWCWRRSRQWDDIFEKDPMHGIGDDDDRSQGPLPAPYHYGLIGHARNPSLSPPGSPTFHPQQAPPHSRGNSSAGVSVVSRESMLPLTANTGSQHGDFLSPTSDYNAHSRQGSFGIGQALLDRPLQNLAPVAYTPPAESSSANTLPRRQSMPAPAPQPRASLYVTNDSEPSGSQRPMSADATLQVPPGAFVSKRQQRPSASGQRPVIVHTDGGRVDGPMSPPTSPPATSEPLADSDSPPAYTKV